MARKTKSARLPATDSLSNLAASLGGGKDKAAGDAFFLADLPRDQIEAMYRGDWLARKIVDIVPYDSIRAWREWAGDRAAVTAIERTERRLGLRNAVQRAMILGRLYGGGAIIVGTAEEDAASLALPLYPEAVGRDGIRFLHVVSRWQLGTDAICLDPLDPYYGEPAAYSLAAPERGALQLHPSRVVRFLGNPLADPALAGAQVWSDSILQTLYDAVHAVALTAAGTTSLVHEAKVDIVTVPNLSDHLSNAATTAQLSARFSYAAAMKSINNLLLLGDGESWARQRIDFAGLPEMVRTFLQMAAGAADIPVTRLLGQSPAGLSATGDSDTRNYYDMIAARQELDLRPRLERLDALLLRSAGVDPDGVSFSFRPLWQLSGAEQAAVALQKAQTTAVYAGLSLWPSATTAALVRSQLLEDGTYPNAEAAFSAGDAAQIDPIWAQSAVADYSPDQPRDDHGRWTEGGGGGASSKVQPKAPAAISAPVGTGSAQAGSGTASHSAGMQQQGHDPNSEKQLLRAALNPLLIALAAHQAVRSVLQTIANLFNGNDPEAAEPKPTEPLKEPTRQPSAEQELNKGQNSESTETEEDPGYTSPLSNKTRESPGQGFSQPSSGSPAEKRSSLWTSPASLGHHFEKHGAEFGATSQKDYAQKAAKFLEDAKAGDFPTKIDTYGNIRIYDPKTNSFGAFNSDGTPRTFFKPSTRGYFDRQPGVTANALWRMQ